MNLNSPLIRHNWEIGRPRVAMWFLCKKPTYFEGRVAGCKTCPDCRSVQVKAKKEGW